MSWNEDYDGYTVEEITAIADERDALRRERDLLQADLVEGLELLKRIAIRLELCDDIEQALEDDIDTYLDGHQGYEVSGENLGDTVDDVVEYDDEAEPTTLPQEEPDALPHHDA